MLKWRFKLFYVVFGILLSFASNAQEQLEKTHSDSLDTLLIRPGIALHQYQNLLLEEAEVSFHRNRSPTHRKTTAKSQETAANRLKTLFRETFSRVIEEQGQLNLVTKQQQDTLRLVPRLNRITLAYLDGSEQDLGKVDIYAKNAGEMTLDLELYDAISGELVAHIIDKREATEWSQLLRQTPSSSRQQARKIIKYWATSLNQRLAESTLHQSNND